MINIPLEFLDTFQVSVIKGNAGELSALAGSMEVRRSISHINPTARISQVSSKGVDSAGSFKDPASFVRELAKRERQYQSFHKWTLMIMLYRVCRCSDRQGRLRLGWRTSGGSQKRARQSGKDNRVWMYPRFLHCNVLCCGCGARRRPIVQQL